MNPSHTHTQSTSVYPYVCFLPCRWVLLNILPLQVWALALIAGVFPLIVILLTAAFYTRSFYDAQVGALGLGLSLGLTATLTDIIKVSGLILPATCTR